MNTYHHEGLHILYNGKTANRICSVVKTSLSGHLVSVYTTTTSSVTAPLSSIVVSNKGILNPSFPVPDMTTNTQKDADIAPVDDTDRFIAVWSSNAASSNFHIYMRSFALGSTGQLVSEGISVQVSQANGDYVAPRVVYNKATKTVLVIWISVANKEVQFKAFKIDENGAFTDASYQQNLNDTFSSEYFSSSLDLHNHLSLSLAFLNIGEKVLTVLKKDANTLGFYSLAPTNGGGVAQTHLSDYAASSIGTFSVAYDSAAPAFKTVYVQGKTGDVYGDSVSYFPSLRGVQVLANPIVLNQTSHLCNRPSIKRTPSINASGEHYFIVAWETTNAATFYNEFTSTYAQVSTEQEINQGDIYTKKPRIVVSDNQTVIVVDASKFEGEVLSQTGILYNVETRQSA
ncbi:hypothetical protein ACMV5L_01755 [Serratia plymuthica]|uniref:hypothetical protein n=1 Tax=Serratia plymuthica TaxID=82996 RepID=UPI003DA588F3